jgi:hypothetical protein
MHNRKATRMKNWKDLTHYVGFDWAKDHHAVVIVDAQGSIVADFEFAHSLEAGRHLSITAVGFAVLVKPTGQLHSNQQRVYPDGRGSAGRQ